MTTVSPPATAGYLDELDELLRTDVDGLVEEYRDVAAANGVDEATLRGWLTGAEPLDYPETAALCGVAVDTLRQWVRAGNKADEDGRPYDTSCFMPPNIRKGSKVRLWNRNRVILFGWRNKLIRPGTLTPTRRTPTGAHKSPNRLKPV